MDYFFIFTYVTENEVVVIHAKEKVNVFVLSMKSSIFPHVWFMYPHYLDILK